MANIKTALAAENATFNDVIKLNIYMVDGCEIEAIAVDEDQES